MALRLIIEDVDGSQTIVPLSDSPVTIGREPDNTIQLTQKNVSRAHARLTSSDDGWRVVDLRSYNGITVNSHAVEDEALLREGDLIRIGDYHLALADDDKTEARTLGLGSGLNDRTSAPSAGASSAQLPMISPQELDAMRGIAPRTSGGSVSAGSHEHELGDDEAFPGHSAGARSKVLGALAVVVIVGVVAWWTSRSEAGSVAVPGPIATTDPANTANSPQTSPTLEPHAPMAGVTGAAKLLGAAASATEPKLAAGPDTEAARAPISPANIPLIADGGREDATKNIAATNPLADTAANPPARPEIQRSKTSRRKNSQKSSAARPSVDPQALLADARKQVMSKKWSEAYAMARRSYRAKKTSGALQVMGLAACKMKDKAKAQAALAKMDKSKRGMLKKSCADSGIRL